MESEAGGQRFFVLEKGLVGSSHDTEIETVDPVNTGEAERCARCGGFIGMLPWLPPYCCEVIIHGEAPGDFVQGNGDDLFLSERFATAFREQGLTGLKDFRPVEVLRVRGRRQRSKSFEAPRYWVATPCLGRGAVDLARSRVRYSKPVTCEECRSQGLYSIHGFTLEEGTWRGEDVFYPRGMIGVLTVSERFERFVARHGFTHMRLTPSEEYVWAPHAPHPLPGTSEGSA